MVIFMNKEEKKELILEALFELEYLNDEDIYRDYNGCWDCWSQTGEMCNSEKTEECFCDNVIRRLKDQKLEFNYENVKKEIMEA